MQRVGGVIDFVPIPGNSIGCKWLRLHRACPEFDMLLVRAHIIEKAKTGRGTADEATFLDLEYTQHAFHDGWVEQHIIIKVVDIGSMALFEQEVTLLGETVARQVAV